MEMFSDRAIFTRNLDSQELELEEFSEPLFRPFSEDGFYGTDSSWGSADLPSISMYDVDSRVIIGSDDRRHITNLQAHPNGYAAVVFLEVTFPNGVTGTGSGTMVGPTTILTAGHVLFSLTHGWATSIRVTPGGTQSNFSSAWATSFSTTNGWVNSSANNPNFDFDYGVIRIGQNLNTGWFGARTETNSTLNNGTAMVIGFPGDKARGTMWYDTGSISNAATRSFRHFADTVGGNSGGPVVLINNWQYVVGIHVAGNQSQQFNLAARVTTDVIDMILNNQ
ncbi:MAG: trypsin-like peptidase domain-containing protein [Defluviitaleaceae bacterium]|nr:trypsin-like peptidase domain-containing protein [Defluviitaleaceae bacterium]